MRQSAQQKKDTELLWPPLEERIRGMAALAKHSEAQIQEVLNGWRRNFALLGLIKEGQQIEFDAVMRARCRVGCISIVADEYIGASNR